MSLIGAGCAAASTESGTGESATPAQLARRLDSVAKSGKFVFGHHDDTAYGHTWVGEPGRSDVLAAAGDYPGMMSWDLGMIEMGDSANLDGVPFATIRREALAQHARGGANTFSWHPRNPATGGDSWDCSDSTTVARIIADSAVSARYDEWCASLAGFFNSLADSAGHRIPVIFRPWHEHTGSWFWWGRNYCTPGQYRELWTRMRRVFDREGVDNVLWAYSPDRVADAETYLERYPGDGYVDIMGVDVYHFNGEEGLEEYISTLRTSLSVAAAVALEHGKLLALTETGSEGIPMPQWYTQVLLPVVRDYPVSYLVVWRNAHDKPGHYYVPFEGHPAATDFRAFAADTTTLFSKDFKKY